MDKLRLKKVEDDMAQNEKDFGDDTKPAPLVYYQEYTEPQKAPISQIDIEEVKERILKDTEEAKQIHILNVPEDFKIGENKIKKWIWTDYYESILEKYLQNYLFDFDKAYNAFILLPTIRAEFPQIQEILTVKDLQYKWTDVEIKVHFYSHLLILFRNTECRNIQMIKEI
jgi:hypothetical protein